MSNGIKKAADCTTRQATQYQKPQDHFTLIADRAKAAVIKAGTWLSWAGFSL